MGVFGFSELSSTKIYPKYLNFRHQVFNKIHKYHESGNPVFQFKTFNLDQGTALNGIASSSFVEQEVGVEYDDYDIPRTLHLAYLSENKGTPQEDANPTILGCLRLLPTDGSYMIKDNIQNGIWKNVDLIEPLPSQANIYEASRIAVAPYLGKDNPLRETIAENLVYANVELGVRLGVKKMVGIMYHHVWQSVYCKRGVPVTYISKPFHVDSGLPIIIGEIDTSPEVLAHLNDTYAKKILAGHIVPPILEANTWVNHYYHVNKCLPLSVIDKPEDKILAYSN